ncbi:MAG: InlB B-repeat-containing protein, partial [Firmicutes bacterium]|nr:InlB B-repeat-containing protein [Bacillota bacterium]
MQKIIKILTLPLIAIIFSIGLAGCNPSANYKIDFIVKGEVYAIVQTDGKTITMPIDPLQNGYTFVAWYWDNNTWQKPFTTNSLLDRPLTENYKVYARFNKNEIEENPHTCNGQYKCSNSECTKESEPVIEPSASFNGFTKVNDTIYSIKVSNTTEFLNIDGITEVSTGCTWVLSTNIFASNPIASKYATLEVGDNHYYV